MPLILAIEPERQQAALLSSLVRGRLGAELVLAHTTEQALAAIGDRVPDLVLIPTLLSAQEDAALAGALRMIAAAANVQMLTIPLLATPAAEPERLGVLAKWRRSKPAVSTAGCDPAVFAEQIASYLADNGKPTTSNAVVEAVAQADSPAPVNFETLVERAAEVGMVDARGPIDLPRPFALIDWQGAPDASAPTVAPATGTVVVADLEALALSDVIVAEVEAPSPSDVMFAEVGGPALGNATFTDVDEAAGAETGLVTELIDEPIGHAVAPPSEAVAVGPAEQTVVTPPSELVLVAGEVSTELIQEPVFEIVAAPRVAQPAPAFVEFDETPIYEVSVDELAGDAVLMASIDAMMATHVRTPVNVPAVQVVAPLEGVPTLTEPDSSVHDVETKSLAIEARVQSTPPTALVAAVVTRAPAKPEWVELIESLRQDIERLKAERTTPIPVAAPLAERPTAVLPPDASPPQRVISSVHTPKRPFFATKKAPRPVQDEWGLFDPDQCGFASLLAKLSEVTEGADKGSSRQLRH